MKKIILLGAAAMLTTLGASAQSKVSIAPEIGANLTTMRGDFENNEMKFGFKGGLAVDIALNNNLSIQPGLFYTQKGTEFEMNMLGNEMKTKIGLDYIELPLNVVYKFGANPGGLFIYGGPYAAYAVRGNVKYQGENVDETVFDDVFQEQGAQTGLRPLVFNRFDAGLNAGLGFMLGTGGFIRANYNLGLTNVHQYEELYENKNSGFSLTLGYMFR